MKVAFFRGGRSPMDRLIRWWTKSPYAHVELLFDDGTMISACPGIGVRSILVASLDVQHWDLVAVPIDHDHAVALSRWCLGELGCHYDWWGLFVTQVLGFPRSHPTKWFCSEFCAAALEHADVDLGIDPCKVSPGALYDLLKTHPTRALPCAS